MITLHTLSHHPIRIRVSSISTISEVVGGSRLIVDSRMLFVSEPPDEVESMLFVDDETPDDETPDEAESPAV